MTDVAPPEQPGWYADAQGEWWWWDGRSWTSASIAGGLVGQGTERAQERTTALLMWVLYLVVGGWIVALVFYLTGKDKRFVRHHAGEALNLTLVLLVPQIIGTVLMLPPYLALIGDLADDPDAAFDVTGGFVAGLVILGLTSLLNYAFGILGAVRAHRGQWSRLPIGVHPVRGVLRKGETPPYDVGR